MAVMKRKSDAVLVAATFMHETAVGPLRILTSPTDMFSGVTQKSSFTVIVTEPDRPPLEAVMSVVPGVMAVTTPALLTDATDGFELRHSMMAVVIGELDEL